MPSTDPEKRKEYQRKRFENMTPEQREHYYGVKKAKLATLSPEELARRKEEQRLRSLAYRSSERGRAYHQAYNKSKQVSGEAKAHRRAKAEKRLEDRTRQLAEQRRAAAIAALDDAYGAVGGDTPYDMAVAALSFMWQHHRSARSLALEMMSAWAGEDAGKRVLAETVANLRRVRGRSYSNTQVARIAKGTCRQCGNSDVVKNSGGFCAEHWFAQSARRHNIAGRGYELRDKWLKQGERCAYSGQEISPGNGMSIDHVIPRSSPDYPGDGDLSNVVWVTTYANLAKNDMPLGEFVAMCGRVVKHAAERQKEKQNGRA